MPKKKVDLLILGSKETVTVNPGPNGDDLGIIDNGGVAVNSGRLVQVASSQLLERKYIAREQVILQDELLLPGFIDPHTHLVFQGSREDEFQSRIEGATYMELLKKRGGIVETVNKTRQATMNDLVSAGMKRLDTALESGTTTIEAKSGYGLRAYDEMKILEAIKVLQKEHPTRLVPTFLGAHAVPPESDSITYTREIIGGMLPRVKSSKLAGICDVFCEKGVFDQKESMMILKAARQLGLATKIHADEFTDAGGAFVANSLKSTSADHLVHTASEELEKMTRTGVIPVLLPASSQSLLSHEYAPGREMLDLGLPVALGTDFSPANWTLSPLTVAAAAARELRMKAADIIRALTLNAARALGLHNEVGSLAPRKQADLVSLKVPNHNWVGYAQADGLVDKVFIDGRLVVSGGKRLD